MTLSDLSKLTPEQRRIRIAEICAWQPELRGPVSGNQWYTTMPDYPNDLNACHEMEKVALKGRMNEYIENVRNVVLRDSKNTPFEDRWHLFPIFAAPAQRSEAFLLTVG